MADGTSTDTVGPVVVFSNTAMSADGKIGSYLHDHVEIGSPLDRDHMSVVRAKADAVLVGGTTFRNWPLPMVERTDLGLTTFRNQRKMINAVVTRTGVLSASNSQWPSSVAELVIFGGASLDQQAHRSRFGAATFVNDGVSPCWAVKQLITMGCKRILVEAGGDVIFSLVKAKLLNQMYLTICPKLLGGKGAPTPLDGQGFLANEMVDLSLEQTDIHGDEIFLRYGINYR